MSSIARKINSRFFFKRMWDYLMTDIFIFFAVSLGIILWFESTIPDTLDVMSRELGVGDGFPSLIYIVKDYSGAVYRYDMGQVYRFAVVPFAILVIVQLVTLMCTIFETGAIRRKLKPLNDLAVKAEQVSQMTYDPSKIRNLEAAINNTSPDNDDVSIHTGDRELRSIEIALNNLLRGMKESERRQARFVDDASHELRTPIAVIQGYVNMLDRWGKDDPGILDESIEALKNESQHMKDLVEQLLFLARGDNGRNHLNLNELNMNEVVEEVCDESMMIDNKHRYSFVPDPEGEVYIMGDTAMVKQSLRILVQNAAKYSEENSEISFKVTSDERTVSYVIQDEGQGMEASDVVHIFERFYRSDQARNSSTGGSGLGLSIAKWIVDAHCGHIEVISRPEIGTRFTVSFDRYEKK